MKDENKPHIAMEKGIPVVHIPIPDFASNMGAVAHGLNVQMFNFFFESKGMRVRGSVMVTRSPNLPKTKPKKRRQ